MTAVGRLVISRLLNFAAGLERVYDPFLFPVLGTKESIKKGKTIFAIQVAVYIYQKYIQCRFIYLFVLYSEISDRFPENGGNRYGSAPDIDDVTSFRLGNEVRINLMEAKAKDFYWLIINKTYNDKHSGPQRWDTTLNLDEENGVTFLILFVISARKIK